MSISKRQLIAATALMVSVGVLVFVISPSRWGGGSLKSRGADSLKDSVLEEHSPTKVRLRAVEVDSLSIDLENAFNKFREKGDREGLLRCFNLNFTRSLAWLANRSSGEKNLSLARVCGFCVGYSDATWGWANFESYFEGDTDRLREAKSGVIDGLLRSGRVLRCLESLVEIEKGVERDKCMVQTLLILAEDDPSRAVMMMKQWIEDGDLLTIDASKMLGAIIGKAHGVGEVEKILALDDFNGLAVGNPSAVARAIAESNVDMATSWGLRIDDWVKSRSAITGIVELKIHRGSDDEAMQIVIEAENSRGGGGYIRSAVMEIAKISPERAVSFIDKLPKTFDVHTRDSVSVLVDVWYAQDGAGLSRWVSELEIGNKRDSAIMALSMIIAPSDPKLAVEWASQIEEDELRIKLTRIVAPKRE